MGDIEMIVDETLYGNHGHLGRVVETFPDRRGFVRQMNARKKTSQLCWSMTKLCLLQEDEET